MTIPQPTVPAAGWYTDPSGQPGQRWWDGTSWTQQTQQTQQTQPAAQPAQQVWPTQPTTPTQISQPTQQLEPAYTPAASGAFATAMQSHASYVPSSASARPAGWYHDATNYGQQRWWDGNQWTAQVSTPYQSGQGYDLRAPAGTSPYNGQIWGIVGIYGFLCFGEYFYIYSLMVDPMGINGTGLGGVPVIFMALLLIGWIVSIWLAASDGRELQSRGIQRPFHWAFCFIPSWGPTIYIIGRSVVARSRTGRGLAPIWWHIGLAVGSFVFGFAVLMSLAGSLSPYGGYGSYGY